MIIRLSVKDNDFQKILEKYLSNFFVNVEETREVTSENAIDGWNKHKKINAMLNPNCSHKLTEYDKVFLNNQIKDSFQFWCKSRYPEKEEYLLKNLEIRILDNMTDKWENGEACYWFQHSGVVLTQ